MCSGMIVSVYECAYVLVCMWLIVFLCFDAHLDCSRKWALACGCLRSNKQIINKSRISRILRWNRNLGSEIRRIQDPKDLNTEQTLDIQDLQDLTAKWMLILQDPQDPAPNARSYHPQYRTGKIMKTVHIPWKWYLTPERPFWALGNLVMLCGCAFLQS